MINIISPVIGDVNEKDRTTLMFAASELQKYLSCVSDGVFSIIPTDSFTSYTNNTIYIGIGISSDLPNVDDEVLDDAIVIDSTENFGIISGNNARSSLIAAYRYLKEHGFRFIRPGRGGERYPDNFEFKKLYVCEKASYRHRAICIEGSVFQQNAIDTIDWLPKAAMNGYFIQFPLPKVFFERWYGEDTPYRDKVNLTDSDIRFIVGQCEDEIQKRSLLYHAVGHGWTARAIGKDGSTWDMSTEPDEEYKNMMALVDGERKLWGGVPQNTNLCYSNPAVRDRVTDGIIEYCINHPDVTYLHFWLADGANNNCECDSCRLKRTSDYYIQMLNELDSKLSSKNITTKIVFLIYVDLLWKPLYEKFVDNSRFVLMFAPISRSYSTSFDHNACVDTKPYVLNKLQFPTDVSENLCYLREWKEEFKCDSFDFDYHFMWDHYFDFSRYGLDNVLYRDIRNLESIGLNGLVSCQAQRAYMPTCVGMNIMADTLWNKNTCFDEVADKVLLAEFGREHSKVKSYLAALSEFGCAPALRGEESVCSQVSIQKLKDALSLISQFKSVIDENIASGESEYSYAWQKLDFHQHLYTMLLEFYLDAATNKRIGDYSHIRDYAQQNELKFKDDFDSWCFFETFELHIVGKLRKNIESN